MNLFMSEVQKAYIAGMMDGEGSINIAKRFEAHKVKDRNDRYCITYQSNVNISNTHQGVLKWIQEKICIGKIDERIKEGNRKKQYSLIIATHQQAEFLKVILPYLIIKKRQAEIVIEYHEIRSTYKTVHFTTEEIKQQREKLYREISSLNMRGV